LSLVLIIFCIIFNDLCMLDHPCIPGMKLTWSWCMIFWICCWIQFANILLRIFASTFTKETGLNSLFLLCSCPIFTFGFVEWVWQCYFRLYFMQKFEVVGISSSLKFW
jgi:hypothetical protein